MDRLDLAKTHIDRLLREKDRVLVAIDGKCTAGKTTLAAQLAEQYDCNVLHMDDFFLRPEQRTKDRYEEIGGNVDYERFYEEALLEPYDLKILLTVDPVAQKQRISNRPLCLQQRFFREWIPMENRYLEAFSIPEKADIVL